MAPIDVNQLDTGFRKASRSVQNGACVEVGLAREAVLVRDSTNRRGTVLNYSAEGWRAFLTAAKVGGFDMPR